MRINAITNEVTTQGLLPFQYESEAGEAGLTGLAGLPLYLELWRAAGLEQAVARHVAVSGAQGWSDRQMVSALVLLNLAGGEGLDDLDRLEADGGLGRLVRAAEAYGQSRRERRAAARRWRRNLRRYHDVVQTQERRRAELFDLCNACVRWVRSLAANVTIEPVTTEPPEVKPGESVEEAVTRIRVEIGETSVERMRVLQAPPTKAEVRDGLRLYVSSMAAMGAPRLQIDRAKPFEAVFHDPRQDFGNSSSFIAATLAWLDPEAFTKRLEAMADALKDDGAMSTPDQDKALAELTEELETLGRQEEALIELAFANGLDILRRGAADPACVLGLRIPQAVKPAPLRKPRPHGVRDRKMPRKYDRNNSTPLVSRVNLSSLRSK